MVLGKLLIVRMTETKKCKRIYPLNCLQIIYKYVFFKICEV